MNYLRWTGLLLCLAGLAVGAGAARADDSVADLARKINPKMVKVFGSGGFKGLPSYGTGLVVSSDGYILTSCNHLLDTQDLRVHLYDGAKYHAKLVASEPLLDVALIKIGDDKDKVEDLPYIDLEEAARKPVVEPGSNILAFSNEFNIATRDEPMSVQHGTIAAYTALPLSRGTSQALMTGNVYVIDAITNNPGAAGGIVTTRKGELIGLIGKELRNDLTNTWVNYAIPLSASAKAKEEDPDKKETIERTVTILDLLREKEKYRQLVRADKEKKGGGYTGLILVPNVVDRTPPYVEEVIPESPAHKAGLKPDDLIVYVGGLPVVSIAMFKDLLENYQPKDEIQLEVRRGDKLETIKLTLEPFPTKAGKKP